MASASDNFNRANETLTDSADWTVGAASTSPELVSNEIEGVASVETIAFFDTFVPTDDQSAEMTITGLVQLGGIWSVNCRWTGSLRQGYTAGHNGNDEGNLDRRLYEHDGVTRTQIATEADDLVVSEVIRVEAEGTTIRMFVDGVEELSATDSTFSGGDGAVILQEIANSADDFKISDLAAVVDPPHLFAHRRPATLRM